MRKHEIELIAALAEGTLEDETEARALVVSSGKARSEYEAQKTALNALASVPSSTLTDSEKAALHRDIWTQLKAQPVATKKATPWYFRWSYAAAGLFLVVGLVAVLNTDGFSGGDDAATEELAAPRDAGETADTTVGAAGGDEGAEAPSIAEDGASADDAVSDEPIVGFFMREASKVRAGQFATAADTSEDEQQSVLDKQAECLLRADLDGYEAVGEVSFADADALGLDPDTSYLIAVPTVEELGEDTPVAFVEVDTCELVHTDE
jgi:hypothetical protein